MTDVVKVPKLVLVLPGRSFLEGEATFLMVSGSIGLSMGPGGRSVVGIARPFHVAPLCVATIWTTFPSCVTSDAAKEGPTSV